MDIEGSEVAAIHGARKLLSSSCRVKHWAISVHLPEHHEMISNFLVKNGYRIEPPRDVKNGWQPNEEILATCIEKAPGHHF